MIDQITISAPALVNLPELNVVRKEERLRDYIDKKKAYLFLKRFFDIVFAVLFLVLVMSWLLPLVALMIKLGTRGPVFFRQHRVGLGGRSFTCYKFRTMVVNREADSRPAGEQDERITRLGWFLRKSNIDEFPQFLNVLMGSMSVVGPRPHMYADCRQFSGLIPSYKFRNMVRPGLTGLAQVKGFHGPVTTAESIRLRFQWDAHYIRNIGWWEDAMIILQTIEQRFYAIIKYVGWKSIRLAIPVIRVIEKEKLWLRAGKYYSKEDKGGIRYILKHVKTGDTVFDIGSHKGGYLYYLLQQAGDAGKVYAFEPQSLLYSYLVRIKKLFHWHNVQVEPLAVSDLTQKATLYIPHNHGRPTSPGATIKQVLQEYFIQKKEEVQTITLDNYCRHLPQKISFLKIDVEGNELAVFRGASALLKRDKPKLLFECEARFVGKEQVQETFYFLEQLGYKGYFIMNDQLLPIDQFSIDRFQQPGDAVYCNNFVFE